MKKKRLTRLLMSTTLTLGVITSSFGTTTQVIANEVGLRGENLNSTVFEVESLESLLDAVTEINAQDSQRFQIVIKKDITVTENAHISFIGSNNIQVVGENTVLKLVGESEDDSILLDNEDSVLTLGSENEENDLIIEGNSGRSAPLVNVKAGTLNLNDGAIIRGNQAATNKEALGVDINNGTFNMYGGIIERNEGKAFGGGVHVGFNSTFNLHGGIIRYNTATRGAGLYLDRNSSFNMTGGSFINNYAGDGAGIDTSLNVTASFSGGSFIGNRSNGIVAIRTSSDTIIKKFENMVFESNECYFPEQIVSLYLKEPINIINCIFNKNKSRNNIFQVKYSLDESYSKPLIENCVFSDNYADAVSNICQVNVSSSGIVDLEIENCDFFNNRLDTGYIGYGMLKIEHGMLDDELSGTVLLNNCRIINNQYYGQGFGLSVSNSLKGKTNVHITDTNTICNNMSYKNYVSAYNTDICLRNVVVKSLVDAQSFNQKYLFDNQDKLIDGWYWSLGVSETYVKSKKPQKIDLNNLEKLDFTRNPNINYGLVAAHQKDEAQIHPEDSSTSQSGASPNRPSGENTESNVTDKIEVIENEDGTKTEKVTKPDGSTTETTKKANGNLEIIEKDISGNETITTKDADENEFIVARKKDLLDKIQIHVSNKSEFLVKADIPLIPADHKINDVKVEVSLPKEKTIIIPIENSTLFSGSVAMIENKNGSLTPIPRSYGKDGSLIIPLKQSCTIVLKDNAYKFNDLNITSPYSTGINFVSAREIMLGKTGKGSDVFDENGTLTRGMFAQIFWNLAGQPSVDNYPSNPEVEGQWFEKAARYALSQKIMGQGGSTFRGSEPISREEVALILYRMRNNSALTTAKLEKYLDTKEIKYGEESFRAFAWASENSILGVGTNYLLPGSYATRGQIAKIIMNYIISGN